MAAATVILILLAPAGSICRQHASEPCVQQIAEVAAGQELTRLAEGLQNKSIHELPHCC
jgi:hypothetical protein